MALVCFVLSVCLRRASNWRLQDKTWVLIALYWRRSTWLSLSDLKATVVTGQCQYDVVHGAKTTLISWPRGELLCGHVLMGHNLGLVHLCIACQM